MDRTIIFCLCNFKFPIANNTNMTAVRKEIRVTLAPVLFGINSMSDNQWHTQGGWGQMRYSSPNPSKT